MWDMTSNQADQFYDASSIIAIIAIVISLLASWGVYIAGKERDRHSNIRHLANERETALANKNAGEANERAEKANLRAQELENQNLKMKLKFAYRSLTASQVTQLTIELSKAPDTLELYVVEDVEAQAYAAILKAAFTHAKWTVLETTMGLGLSTSGLTIRETQYKKTINLGLLFKRCNIESMPSSEPALGWSNIIVGIKPTIVLD
jgi:hypothetical protein